MGGSTQNNESTITYLLTAIRRPLQLQSVDNSRNNNNSCNVIKANSNTFISNYIYVYKNLLLYIFKRFLTFFLSDICKGSGRIILLTTFKS